ncbi:sugar nucleotide-binding protein [Shewanella sp. GD03713]|uniref:SDR family oxidoreductase n=1 Tax=Shewanella sp. GD03713 TaxID=2975372 RepID=UPI000B342C93|nr:sugar nucleotide-binding protein [Shewanella sp. GD03713]MDH1471077.1 NAD(P)-dependent oxidoreductase [Shewanella sp. GD03713]QXN26279.1 NAD(P)-dependent oxidoreductase [Shewanella putrefaciens]VEE60689.1 dTDP-4-dehydrorhamnose reductase [Shewanella putrefaciens]
MHAPNGEPKSTVTVLLTAADSQLAKALLRTLAKAAYRLDGRVFRVHALSHAQLDIGDKQSVAAAFAHFNPEWVINCAAYNAVDRAETAADEAYRVNSLGPELLASECALTGARLVHISSDYVFSGEPAKASELALNQNGITRSGLIESGLTESGLIESGLTESGLIEGGLTENATPAPLSVYGQSKLAGEQAVLRILAERAIVIRTAWLYGVDGHNFVKTMLRLMATIPDGQPLTVINDQIGSPTWVDALAHLIWQLIASPLNVGCGSGLFHYAGQGQCSWYEFALEIQRQALALKLLDKAVPISAIDSLSYAAKALEKGNKLAARPSYSALNSGRVRQCLTGQNSTSTHSPELWRDWRWQLKVMLEDYAAQVY